MILILVTYFTISVLSTTAPLVNTYTEGAGTLANSVAVSEDNTKVVSVGFDGIVRFWNPLTGLILGYSYSKGSTIDLFDVVISNGNVFVGCSDNTIVQLNLNTGGLIRVFNGHYGPVYSVFVYNTYLFSGSGDNAVIHWNINDGIILNTFSGHADKVLVVAFDGQFLYSGSMDKTIKQWILSSTLTQNTFTGHSGRISGITLSAGYIYTV